MEYSGVAMLFFDMTGEEPSRVVPEEEIPSVRCAAELALARDFQMMTAVLAVYFGIGGVEVTPAMRRLAKRGAVKITKTDYFNEIYSFCAEKTA